MPPIGHWHFDADSLPLYHYTGAYPARALTRTGEDAQLPDDPCFILGNYRLTLFAHVSGRYQLITGERGWARLNHGGKNQGFNQSTLRVAPGNSLGNAPALPLCGPEAAPSVACTARAYGVGYARITHQAQHHLLVTKELAVTPSPALHAGNSAFLLTVTLHNSGARPLAVHYREEILANYTLMNDQDFPPGSPGRRVDYPNRLDVDPTRSLALADIAFQPAQLLLPPTSPDESYTHDIAPPLLFLHAAPVPGANVSVSSLRTAAGDILSGEAALVLAPGESRVLRFVIGFSFDRTPAVIDRQITELLALPAPQPDAGPCSPAWHAALPDFHDEPDAVLRREMLWNAYVLLALATYSQYFKETFVPQGTVYAYHQGFNASNRDHLQHLLPLIHTRPDLAKSCLRHAMKHSLHDGEIKRQNIGYGYSDPGIYMESDPQLYMFMAVAEYLRITRDHAFLDDEIRYYPMESGRTDTVLTLLAKHFIYLRDTVRTGRHGLVRMLNSDWSDSFFHRHSPNIHLWSAESHMNSTMALAVLPSFLRELQTYAAAPDRALADQLIAGLDAYHTALHAAVMRDLEGRTFAPRCYLGDSDQTALHFGVDTLCLEAQPFLLLAENFPVERKRALYAEIRARVLDMEKFGARTREVPLWGGEGRGEDGGIWFSHQGPLIAGVATFDRAEAMCLLRALTFDAYARHYPDYWMGHWTTADSLESTLSSREGLYHFWLPDAFQPFCAHAHAWQLYCYCQLRQNSA